MNLCFEASFDTNTTQRGLTRRYGKASGNGSKKQRQQRHEIEAYDGTP
ncbi:MAG: hypothetical protein J5526_09160 [Bacteroidales bacterium]|nr:hypothetical protein [Bacteroidales bacterium]